MAKHNAANTRIKRAYFHYLKEARRCGVASVDATAKAISRFEEANLPSRLQTLSPRTGGGL